LDKRTIIIVVLLAIVLIFWSQIAQQLGLVKPAPSQPPVTAVDTLETPASHPPITTDTSATYDTSTDQSGQVSPTAPAQIGETVPDSTIPEELMVVTTPLYEITFTTYGGGIKEIKLNQYSYYNGKEGAVVLKSADDPVVPDFKAAGGSYSAANLAFSTNDQGFSLGESDTPRKISFVYDNQKGGKIIKTYTINPDHYHIDLDLAVEGIETFGFERSYQMAWGSTPPPTEKNIEDDYGQYKAVVMLDDYEEIDDYDNGVMNQQLMGFTRWGGIRTKYFAVVMIPRTRNADGMKITGQKWDALIDQDKVEVRKISVALEMPIANYGTTADNYTIYIGPIDYNRLEEYKIGLEELASLGWKIIISWFSIGIIWLLPKIYSVIPNYGIVIIIFAFLIKLITYPLSRKQNLAMARMKDLQPKMKALQEKYKTDPQRLNKEMMKLYKTAGANPLSGCLPMLPQLPLFFALFTVFRTTIEFRGASFIGWISDLSTPDPYYILPVIMVIVMFVQQKMTMTDPKNKMLTYMMPLFFGYISLSFPAGLVLYWTAFSLLSYAETLIIRKTSSTGGDAVVVQDAT